MDPIRRLRKPTKIWAVKSNSGNHYVHIALTREGCNKWFGARLPSRRLVRLYVREEALPVGGFRNLNTGVVFHLGSLCRVRLGVLLACGRIQEILRDRRRVIIRLYRVTPAHKAGSLVTVRMEEVLKP